MENKQFNYKVIKEERLAHLLELELLVDKLGLGSTVSKYEKTKKGIKLLGYVEDELDKYCNFSDIIEDVLDAENISNASDEEKEDMLYVEEENFCDCDCDFHNHEVNDEDTSEEEGTYLIFYLEEEESDDEDDWADEFDDFYSDSFENSIFKEMEDFINGEYSTSTERAEEEEEDMPDSAIFDLELYQILKDYFKKLFK